MKTDPKLGRATALRNGMLTYMNDREHAECARAVTTTVPGVGARLYSAGRLLRRRESTILTINTRDAAALI